MNNITYHNTISADEYCSLRKSVGWKAVSPRQLDAGLAKNVFLVSARCGEECVGMTRLVGDGGYFYLLVDVIVLPEYQGKGIGKTMVSMAMDFILGNIQDGETVFVNVMSAGGKEPFYRKFGFIERPSGEHGSGMAMYLNA